MDKHDYHRGQHQVSSLNSAMVSLDRHEELWTGVASNIFLKIEFLRKLDFYDYRDNSYVKKRHPGLPQRDIYSVNEHLAVLLSFVANALVVLVFTRVLGLARLPSRIIVSMASANLVTGLAYAIHTTSISVSSFSDTPTMCRFVPFIVAQCWILYFFCLAVAIVERIIACNIPSFYSRAMHILSPAILVSPWGFWTLNMIMLQANVFEYDAGYECASHLNFQLPLSSMNVGPKSMSAITCILLCGLVLSMMLHNQNSGDVWEMNRMQFELRTTAVILKLAVASLAFTLPMLSMPLSRFGGTTYAEYRLIHFTAQLSMHKGIVLMLVLLSRHEFRRQLVLVFESSESIRRTRTTNLLITHGSARNYSSRMLSSSGGTTNVQEVSSGESVSMSRPARPSTQPPAPAVSSQLDQGLISRDKISAVHTPEWLKKKENKQQWQWGKMYNRTMSILTASQVESDV